MKKQVTGFGVWFLLVAWLTVTAFDQQEKNKGKGKQDQQQPGKKNNPGQKNEKDNPGNSKNANPNKNNGNKTPGVISENPAEDKGNPGKGNSKKGVKYPGADYGYAWNRETFKDRHKVRNAGKVTICHKFNKNNEPGVTINVSSNAVKAHMNHGDVMGTCPTVSGKRFSDIFKRKRDNYYNYIEENQEQAVYSRSILDYALERLTNSRQQLLLYQNSNMPPVEIQRKQAAVVELEENVSLLETLLGVAAELLVNKLM